MKRKDVRPFISIKDKDIIYRMSYLTGISIAKMCEELCLRAFRKGIIDELSPYFKYDIQIDEVNYKGNRNAGKFEYQSKDIERVTLQLNENDHEYAYNLSWSMKCSVSKIVGYAIEKAINDYELLNQYVNDVLIKKVSENKREEFLQLIGKVNEIHNGKEYGEASLLLYIAEEFMRLENGTDEVLEIAKS